MNERENTQLIQQTYQSLKEGNVEALVNLLAEDIEFRLPEMDNVPFAGNWAGPYEVRQFFDKVFELQDVVEFEPKEYIAQGDTVVVLGRFTMRIKTSGKDFSSEWAHVWKLKNGKVTRFYEYVDTAIVSRAHTAAQTAAKTF